MFCISKFAEKKRFCKKERILMRQNMKSSVNYFNYLKILAIYEYFMTLLPITQ